MVAILPPTRRLYEEDAYLARADAEVVAVSAPATKGANAPDAANGAPTPPTPPWVRLDATIFYAEGGGQPGDAGVLRNQASQANQADDAGDAGNDNSTALRVADTRKGTGNPGAVLHFLEATASLPQLGTKVSLEIDWARRHRLMRMHTAMHLLCSLVDGGVTGCNIGDGTGRIDFAVEADALNKERLTEAMRELVARNAAIASRWIDEAELESNASLVRTLSVKPPRGAGRVRLIEVEGVDLQPCGGTHVRATGEIGAIAVRKIENKGRGHRRVHLILDAPAAP